MTIKNVSRHCHRYPRLSIIPDWEPPFHTSVTPLTLSLTPSPSYSTKLHWPFCYSLNHLTGSHSRTFVSTVYGMLLPQTDFPRLFPQFHMTNALTSFKYLLKHHCLNVTSQQLFCIYYHMISGLSIPLTRCFFPYYLPLSSTSYFFILFIIFV